MELHLGALGFEFASGATAATGAPFPTEGDARERVDRSCVSTSAAAVIAAPAESTGFPKNWSTGPTAPGVGCGVLKSART
jgi:hypothetical protein